MKMHNLKNGLRLMPILLLAGLSSCNNGSKSNNNAPTNLQISGVNYNGFQHLGNQSCTFGANNSSYQCNELNFGTTQVINFNSQQELCNNLRNPALHYAPGSSYEVAYTVRDNYFRAYCQAYGNTLGSNGIGQYDTNIIRNLKCSLSAETLDGAFGNTGEMNFLVPANTGRGTIYAVMVKQRKAWGIFNLTTTRPSSKYLQVNYQYQKATSSKGDQLTLDVNVDGTIAKISGFAGSEVALNLENVNDVSRAEVSCSITEANNPGVKAASSEYRCSVSGPADQVVRAPVVVSVSELVNNALTFTTEESFTNVTMNAEGSFALRQGTAVFTATHQGKRDSMMNITARANLSTPTTFTVTRGSKTVGVSCN